MQESLSEIQAIVGLVTSVWGVIALFLGPWLFFKARSYFPERKETITPDQLREQLSTIDHAIRDAFQREIGGLSTRVTDVRTEILEALTQLEVKTNEAHDRSLAALHKAELVEQRLHGFDRLVIEKIEHLQTSIRTGK